MPAHDAVITRGDPPDPTLALPGILRICPLLHVVPERVLHQVAEQLPLQPSVSTDVPKAMQLVLLHEAASMDSEMHDGPKNVVHDIPGAQPGTVEHWASGTATEGGRTSLHRAPFQRYDTLPYARQYVADAQLTPPKLGVSILEPWSVREFDHVNPFHLSRTASFSPKPPAATQKVEEGQLTYGNDAVGYWDPVGPH